MTSSAHNSGLQVMEVRVSNFRSLKNICIKLTNLTVLVGANNAGKTSFLEAMFCAMGASRKNLSQEDIYLDLNESVPDRTKKITIDILVRPFENGEEVDVFPPGSYWTGLWGTAISQYESSFNDFLAFRTVLEWSPTHADYVLVRKFLADWPDEENWLEAQEKSTAPFSAIEPIALHYIDAKRDLEEDLRKSGSFWRRLTNDLGLSQEAIEQFEETLNNLNSELIGNSEVLRHLQSNLSDIQSVISAENGSVEISPVARRLQDLSKGIDVSFATQGGRPFALTRHGMGTRSLASLMVFKAYALWRENKARESDQLVHSILALEEPESHLHPQAQRSFYDELMNVPGQRVISTHSPYIAGQADLGQLRLFLKTGVETRVKKLDLSALEPDDIRRIDRLVVATRGDILFSRAIILFEGETEDQAFPIWASSFWGKSIDALGLSFVGIGGTHYFPFIWLAKCFDIPWFVFSDGEPQPVRELNRALNRAGEANHDQLDNVHVLPEGDGLEEYLVKNGYQPEIEQAIVSLSRDQNKIDNYIQSLDGKPAAGGRIRDYSNPEGRKLAILDYMKENKTKLASHIAQSITDSSRPGVSVPNAVSSFLQTVSNQVGIRTSLEDTE